MEIKEMIMKKLDFYIEYKVKLHIKKRDHEFLNGFVIKKKGEDTYVFLEDKFGEMILFADEVYHISEYIKDKK